MLWGDYLPNTAPSVKITSACMKDLSWNDAALHSQNALHPLIPPPSFLHISLISQEQSVYTNVSAISINLKYVKYVFRGRDHNVKM